MVFGKGTRFSRAEKREMEWAPIRRNYRKSELLPLKRVVSLALMARLKRVPFPRQHIQRSIPKFFSGLRG